MGRGRGSPTRVTAVWMDNGFMKINRRTTVRILAGAAAASRATLGAPQPPADKQLQSARGDLKDAGERIARIKLPRATEPAFRFRA